MKKAAGQLWRSLVSLGFRLLYNELAWLYDPVSWIASLGHWRRWQSTMWPHLPKCGRILEVGSGTGHVLESLLIGGYQPVGLDPSPMMLRQAQRRLSRQGLAGLLCRGRAENLPFTDQAFQAIVCTFPTAFIHDPAWLAEAMRVLQVGGKLIVVEMAYFSGRTLPPRCLEWLYQITGQRGPTPDLVHLLDGTSLKVQRESVNMNGSMVNLILAVKG